MSGVHKDHGPSCDGCLMVGLIDRAEKAEDRADRLAATVLELLDNRHGECRNCRQPVCSCWLTEVRALLDHAVDGATDRPVSLERGDDGANGLRTDRERPSIRALEDSGDRIAAYLTEQASARFDQHGPHDARGAAFWDVATGIREGRIPHTAAGIDEGRDT